MYGILLYNLNKEEENYRATEVQRRRLAFCPCSVTPSNNPAKRCLLTPLQTVTSMHSSCSPHNQSFLSTKRPGIHAGFCIVHLASYWPTPYALAPTQRKKGKHGKTGLGSQTVIKAFRLKTSKLFGHVQSQLW